MHIIGHGIDIVETARVAKMLGDHGERFLRRCFTEGGRDGLTKRTHTTCGARSGGVRRRAGFAGWVMGEVRGDGAGTAGRD